MARDGLRAVTHRAVGSEMGASARAATYYFDSIDALIEAAFVHYVDRALDRFEQVGAALPLAAEPALGARALAAVVLGDVLGDRDGLVAEYTLVLEMTRRPALEPVYARWQASLEEMLKEHLAAWGAEDPNLHARLVLATLRGLELEALARPSRVPRLDDLAAVFEALLVGLASRAPRGARGR